MGQVNFPPPTDADDFERLVEQIAGPVLRSNQVNLNGRRGQRQHGVDISVQTAMGEVVGIQCKLTSTLTAKTVEAEVEKAKTYVPALDLFILATSARSDAPLQAAVREIESPFRLVIWSWDELNIHINRLPGVALDYVQHVLTGDQDDAEHRHAYHLREAMDRPALLYGAHAERDFTAQRDALRDVSQFLRTGILYTRDGALVSGLPYRRYGDSYSDSLARVLDRVSKLDAYTGRKLSSLADHTDPEHARSINEAERCRLDVLDAANLLLRGKGVAPLPLSV